MGAERQPQQQAFFEAAAALWPLAKGSIAQVRRPCIRPGCAACAHGERHPAWIFTFRQGGRQRCRYVREALVPALRQAIANGRRLEAMLVRAGEALVERDRAERSEDRRVRRRRAERP
jgi:hypothetical protein